MIATSTLTMEGATEDSIFTGNRSSKGGHMNDHRTIASLSLQSRGCHYIIPVMERDVTPMLCTTSKPFRVDEGGFGLVQERKNKNYLKSLRTYSTQSNIPKADILRSSQHRVSPFSKPQLQILNATQSELSSRLCRPKLAEDPYK